MDVLAPNLSYVCSEAARHRVASPVCSANRQCRRSVLCVSDSLSKKKHRLRHVDARQEWVQLLRDSNLVKNVHVDTFENLSDMNIRQISAFLHRLSQADDALSV
jgi:hypothetical protein